MADLYNPFEGPYYCLRCHALIIDENGDRVGEHEPGCSAVID